MKEASSLAVGACAQCSSVHLYLIDRGEPVATVAIPVAEVESFIAGLREAAAESALQHSAPEAIQ